MPVLTKLHNMRRQFFLSGYIKQTRQFNPDFILCDFLQCEDSGGVSLCLMNNGLTKFRPDKHG